MRSRYAAFALGLGDYLVLTLASSHPDRARPLHELARELSRAQVRQRFTGLRIVRATSSGDSGQVWFFARVFERGIDRSFGELSTFVREAGAWRYASGEPATGEELSGRV
jgi:SEC-C motif-containing protein